MNPTKCYLMSSSTTQNYIFKEGKGGALTTNFTINFLSPPTSFMVSNSHYMIGLENGSIYYSKDDALLPFSASRAVSKLYYNTSSLNLIVGDALGEILVASREPSVGFSLNFSYHEHSCRIISIIVVGDWIITSDECGYIVQYDMVDQLLLDKTTHPGRTGNQKLMLTHWMDGDFGVGLVENQSSVYLYRISD